MGNETFIKLNPNCHSELVEESTLFVVKKFRHFDRLNVTNKTNFTKIIV